MIVSHHRLPKFKLTSRNKKLALDPDLELVPQWLDEWHNSYWNSVNFESDKFKEHDFISNWVFKKGTPIKSQIWCDKARSIAVRALKHQVLFAHSEPWLDDRFTSHLARLCLMLADHTYSASGITPKWRDKKYKAIANTSFDKEKEKSCPKQQLDEHNIGVGHNAYLIAKNLPKLKQNLPAISRLKVLKQPAKIDRFKWQDKAYQLALSVNQKTQKQGFFGINMASTGLGKTFANAKIMYGLADEREGCRFSIALGLRTLTLQTGDALQERMKLADDDLAVLIGSRAVKELHQLNQSFSDHSASPSFEDLGSESAEPFFAEHQYVRYDGEIYDGMMKRWFDAKGRRGQSAHLGNLLSAPVLISTIDHLIPATEGERGGHQIAPMLRLLTSDLVLDEPDDFDQGDLPALCRLVNWAGMLGSRVLLSSATLPPSIVSALFEAYKAGREQFNKSCGDIKRNNAIVCAWFDETTKPFEGEYTDRTNFSEAHRQFVEKRVRSLKKIPVLRRAELLNVVTEGQKPADVIKGMAAAVSTGINQLHINHHQVHKPSGKRISIGLVRMANIRQMVALAKSVLRQTPSEDSRIHYCIYHSKHPLIVRSSIEKTLDRTLQRHEPSNLWEVKAIKNALDTCPEKNQLFVVFATAVAEIGRDHDYDWAIAEPSSMRSLIQLAGRILRHRQKTVEESNLLILDQNYRALTGCEEAYVRPGFESKHFKLVNKDLGEALKSKQYQSISAIPRIQESESFKPEENLVALEHALLNECLFGINKKIKAHASVWWLEDITWNAELQRRTRFRKSQADELFIRYWEEEDEELVFRGMDKDGNLKNEQDMLFELDEIELADRVQSWMNLDIKDMLLELAELKGMELPEVSKRFTEIRLPEKNDQVKWLFHSEFGVYRALD